MKIIDDQDADFNNPELEKYAEHKKMAVELNLGSRIAAIKAGDSLLQRKSLRVSSCGSFLTFDEYAHKESGELMRSLHSANFCKDRFCPMCQWRKSMQLVAELHSIFTRIDMSKYQLIFMTLTVKNPPMAELRSTLKRLSDSFKLFTKYKEVKKVFKGFVRAVEFLGDRTKPGEAHPHYHLLVLVDKWYFTSKDYLSQKKWQELWARALAKNGLFCENFDVRKVTSRDPSKYWLEAVLETAKYTVKLSKVKALPKEDFDNLYLQTKGIKQYYLGGLLREIDPEETEIDPETWEFLRTVFYKWRAELGLYETVDIEVPKTAKITSIADLKKFKNEFESKL
jgi:plasmid rolling circle replication initiator protein Rep